MNKEKNGSVLGYALAVEREDPLMVDSPDDDLMMGASILLESMKHFKSYYFKEHKRNPSVKFYSDKDIEEMYGKK